MSGIFFVVCFNDQIGDWIDRFGEIYKEMAGKEGGNRREDLDIITQMERTYGIVINRYDLFVCLFICLFVLRTSK